MKRTWPLMVTLSLALTACAPASNEDLQQYIAKVQAETIAGIPPLPALPELARVDYVGEQARNPFLARAVQLRAQRENSTSCPQPDLQRQRGELETLALDQLQFTGTMNSRLSGFTALVISNQGRLYRVNVNDYIGPNYGQVSAIDSQQITIKEWIPTGDGCWQQRESALKLNSSPRS